MEGCGTLKLHTRQGWQNGQSLKSKYILNLSGDDTRYDLDPTVMEIKWNYGLAELFIDRNDDLF